MSRRAAVAELAPEDLAATLQTERAAADVRRADELARTTAEAAHDRARANVSVQARLDEMERAEREAAAAANADLARMYRQALAAGERTRITAGLARSAEARALRLEKLRGLNLRVLVPVLIGFAAWSTTGVQAGGAQLMGVTNTAPMWWALWLLEPVLIGAVVWVIIARAQLAASGGRLAEGAERIAWGCLATSVVLNLVAGAASEGGVLAMVGAMLAHAIGPVGAAATAHLIGVVDSSVTAADPWTEQGRPVPGLADMDLRPPTRRTLGDVPESTPESVTDRPVTVWPVAPEGRALLPIVARPTAPEEVTQEAPESAPLTWPVPTEGRALLTLVARPAVPETAPRTGDDLPKEPVTRARRTTRPAARPNKGAKVPPVLKPAPDPSPRQLSDADLAERLAALVAAGDLAPDAPVRAVQTALGIGFVRAKRIAQTVSAPAANQADAA